MAFHKSDSKLAKAHDDLAKPKSPTKTCRMSLTDNDSRPNIKKTRLRAAVQQDVARFKVSMHHTRGVDVLQGPEGLVGDERLVHVAQAVAPADVVAMTSKRLLGRFQVHFVGF